MFPYFAISAASGDPMATLTCLIAWLLWATNTEDDNPIHRKLKATYLLKYPRLQFMTNPIGYRLLVFEPVKTVLAAKALLSV